MAAGRGDPQRLGFGSGPRLVFGYVFTLKNGRAGFHPPNENCCWQRFHVQNGRAGLCGYVFTLKIGRVGFHPPNELVFGYVFTLKMGGSGFILR